MAMTHSGFMHFLPTRAAASRNLRLLRFLPRGPLKEQLGEIDRIVKKLLWLAYMPVRSRHRPFSGPLQAQGRPLAMHLAEAAPRPK